MDDSPSTMQRILRMPLLYKILLANSAVVGIGAIFGTMITVWHVRTSPDLVHYPLIAIFATAGIAISFFVNRWVLRWTMQPLNRLQAAIDRVRRGERQVRVSLGNVSDEQFDRLAETVNRMLEENEHYTRQMQRLPRQILQAQEKERQRLARELHDEAAQALTSLLVHLRLLERAHSPAKAQQQVQSLRELTAQALEEVRRVALDLRPTILDDLGLVAALEWRADEFTKANGIDTEVSVSGFVSRLPRDIELVFYRVGQESLSNIAKHADAQHVTLSLRREDDGCISLAIVDDGKGFVPKNTAAHNGGLSGLGLVGMRERMAMIGGTLTIDSTPGQGTRIQARAPLPEFAAIPVETSQ